MSAKFLAGLGLVLGVVAGCEASAPQPVALAIEPILGGVRSDVSDDAVVRLEATHSSGTTQTCTAALVAPNLLLTARHCIADYVTLDFTCDSNGDLVRGPGGAMGTVVPPERVSVRTGVVPRRTAAAVALQIFSLQTTTICRNDIALVLLDRSLDIPPIPIRLDRGTTVGETIRALGYGVSDEADAQFGVRHSKDGLVVTKVGTSQYRSVGDNIPPRSFQTDGGGLCMGDSGGPALSDVGAVIGVFSKKTGDCTSPTIATYFTETGPFSDELIRPAFAAAGFEPILESLAGNAGAAGSNTAGSGGAAGADSSSAGRAGADHAMAGTANTPAAGAGPSAAGMGTGAVGAGTTGATDGMGGEGGTHSTTTTPAAGGEELIYEGAPPRGGSCSCRLADRSRSGIDWLVGFAGLFLVLRRKAARSTRIHSSRLADRLHRAERQRGPSHAKEVGKEVRSWK